MIRYPQMPGINTDLNVLLKLPSILKPDQAACPDFIKLVALTQSARQPKACTCANSVNHDETARK